MSGLAESEAGWRPSGLAPDSLAAFKTALGQLVGAYEVTKGPLAGDIFSYLEEKLSFSRLQSLHDFILSPLRIAGVSTNLCRLHASEIIPVPDLLLIVLVSAEPVSPEFLFGGTVFESDSHFEPVLVLRLFDDSAKLPRRAGVIVDVHRITAAAEEEKEETLLRQHPGSIKRTDPGEIQLSHEEHVIRKFKTFRNVDDRPTDPGLSQRHLEGLIDSHVLISKMQPDDGVTFNGRKDLARLSEIDRACRRGVLCFCGRRNLGAPQKEYVDHVAQHQRQQDQQVPIGHTWIRPFSPTHSSAPPAVAAPFRGPDRESPRAGPVEIAPICRSNG